MERLNSLYAVSFNQRYARVGHRFQRRFESRAIGDETYLAAACEYVWANPVRSGLCASRSDWPWSGLGGPARPRRISAERA
jgi:hypothetical protein